MSPEDSHQKITNRINNQENTNRNYDNRSTPSREDFSIRDIPYNSSVQLAWIIQPCNTVNMHNSTVPMARADLESRDQYDEDSRTRNDTIESNYVSTSGLLRCDSLMDGYSRRGSQLREYRGESIREARRASYDFTGSLIRKMSETSKYDINRESQNTDDYQRRDGPLNDRGKMHTFKEYSKLINSDHRESLRAEDNKFRGTLFDTKRDAISEKRLQSAYMVKLSLQTENHGPLSASVTHIDKRSASNIISCDSFNSNIPPFGSSRDISDNLKEPRSVDKSCDNHFKEFSATGRGTENSPRDFSAQDRDESFVRNASFVRVQEMSARTKEILLKINGFYGPSANATLNSTSPMSKISSFTTSQSSPGQGREVQNRISLASGQSDLIQNGPWEGGKKQNMIKEASGQRGVRKNRMMEAPWQRSEEHHTIREVSWQRDKVQNTTLIREALGHGDLGQNRISKASGHEVLGPNRTRKTPEQGDKRQKSICVAPKLKGEGPYKIREAPGQDDLGQTMIKYLPGQGGEGQNKTREAPGQNGERQSRIRIINPTTFFAHPDATVTGGVEKVPLMNRSIETSLCRQSKVDVTEPTTENINSNMNRNVHFSCIDNTQNRMRELMQKYNLVAARFCSTQSNEAKQQSVEKSNIAMQCEALAPDSSVPCPERTLQSTYRSMNPINSSTFASPQEFTDDVVNEPPSITAGNRNELVSTPPANIECSSKFANIDNKSKFQTDLVSSTTAMDVKDWGLKCAVYFHSLQGSSTAIEMADGAREDGAEQSRTDDAMYVADEVHPRGQSENADVRRVSNAIRDISYSRDTKRREIILKVGGKESHKYQDQSKSQKREKNKSESRSPLAKQFKREQGSQVGMKRKKSINGESTNNKTGDTTKNIPDESKRCDRKENKLKFESRKRKLGRNSNGDRSKGRERRPNKNGSDRQECRSKENEERRVQIIVKLLNIKRNKEIKTGITQPLAPVLCYWMINRNGNTGREIRA